MPDEIMTIRGVANYMKMNERTIYKLVRAGKLPAVKVANQWRFKKSWLDRWLEAQVRGVNLGQPTLGRRARREEVPNLSSLLREETICTNLAANTGEEVLEELVDMLVEAGFLRFKGPFLRAVQEREVLYTTAVEPGVAIPHARWVPTGQVVEPAIAFGRSERGVDFKSLDGTPTHLFFLPCAPEDGLHLRILAKLGRLLRQKEVIEELKRAETPRTVIQLIGEWEGQFEMVR